MASATTRPPANPACEQTLYDSASLRRFVGIDPGPAPTPDSTSTPELCKRFDEHQLGQTLFAKVGERLQARGFKVDTGAIVEECRVQARSQKDLIASKAAKDFSRRRTRYAGLIGRAMRAKRHNKSRIGPGVEHVFDALERLWELGKRRYLILQKNATRALTALALPNIDLTRQDSMTQVRP